MKCFIGLGNPGKKYESTRHNIGFMAIDAFAFKWNISMTGQKFKSVIGEGNVNGQKVLLVKPQTFMNLSGEAVRAVMDFYKLGLDEIIILYDDLDIPVGRMKLRYKGGSGGHNGIKSIIQHIGTEQFNRMRIGISRPVPGFDIADYVLSSFKREEIAALEELLSRISSAMEYAIEEPFEKVMAKFN